MRGGRKSGQEEKIEEKEKRRRKKGGERRKRRGEKRKRRGWKGRSAKKKNDERVAAKTQGVGKEKDQGQD